MQGAATSVFHGRVVPVMVRQIEQTAAWSSGASDRKCPIWVLGVRDAKMITMVCLSLKDALTTYVLERLRGLQRQRAVLLVRGYVERRLWRIWRHRRLPHTHSDWEASYENANLWIGRHVEFFVAIAGQE